ncbi:DUF6538 domain-containing protein [Hyphomicrobium denitrificans]|uniref:DUF6538 domain-containing protein n=1 Tax=Hyphomicrobium denitrificans TaxID=53399 RepID=UPI003CC91F87
MTRKRGIYTYRRRLPRPHSGEVTPSLGTTSFRSAQAETEVLADAFDRFFRQQQQPMTIFDIHEALRAYLREELRQL